MFVYISDDYYSHYDILNQATPNYTTALSLMSYAALKEAPKSI